SLSSRAGGKKYDPQPAPGIIQSGSLLAVAARLASPGYTKRKPQLDPDECGESEHSAGSIKAQAEMSLPYSIISKKFLTNICVPYTPCTKGPVHDSKNVRHAPVGRVNLRWSKKEKGKSHAETFYVVDRAQPLVILGATAYEGDILSAGQKMQPIGLKQQMAGEKAEMERKRKEAAERRSLETKEQERMEAVRRQQEAQAK
ncbi:MAG: hypothetical protein Q9173_006483, partial [Seirophora scorigena]